jgi:hypothetical protein
MIVFHFGGILTAITMGPSPPCGGYAAGGQPGGQGPDRDRLLLERGLSVRAMVRREDVRAAALRAAGAEVVVGDLLEPADVYPSSSFRAPPPRERRSNQTRRQVSNPVG